MRRTGAAAVTLPRPPTPREARCRYVMTMEEDWVWLPDKAAVPAVHMAISVQTRPLVTRSGERSESRSGRDPSHDR